MKAKKIYSSPTLTTQIVQLGVFGNYNIPQGSKTEPGVTVVDRDLRME